MSKTKRHVSSVVAMVCAFAHYSMCIAISLAAVSFAARADEGDKITALLEGLETTCTEGIDRMPLAYENELVVGAFLLQGGAMYDAEIDAWWPIFSEEGFSIRASYSYSPAPEKPDWSKDQLLFTAAISPFLVISTTAVPGEDSYIDAEFTGGMDPVPRLFVQVNDSNGVPLEENVTLSFMSWVQGDSPYQVLKKKSAGGYVMKCVTSNVVYVTAQSLDSDKYYAGPVRLTDENPCFVMSSTGGSDDCGLGR